MSDPHFIYNPDDWEYTSEWADRDELADSHEVRGNDVARFSTLVKGPDKFCAHVGVGEPDDEGEFDCYEYRWFDSEAEARAALTRHLPPAA